MPILHSKIYNPESAETPLLVFHGLFGMLDNWASFGKEFSEYRPVHLVDLRNHGKSFHSPDMNLELLSHDILNYMNHFELKKAHLLGHSLGGKAVMQFAINHSAYVERLIVVDIAPKAYPPHHQGVIKALQGVDFSVLNSRKDIEQHLMGAISELGVVPFLLKNLYWNESKNLAWRFNLDVLVSHYEEFVGNAITYGQFFGETLFIAGEKSHYILAQDELLIGKQFPNYRLVRLSKAGHWVQAENPKDFFEEMSKFLQFWV